MMLYILSRKTPFFIMVDIQDMSFLECLDKVRWSPSRRRHCIQGIPYSDGGELGTGDANYLLATYQLFGPKWSAAVLVIFKQCNFKAIWSHDCVRSSVAHRKRNRQKYVICFCRKGPTYNIYKCVLWPHRQVQQQRNHQPGITEMLLQ